ncbi:MAG: hypothetical protein V1872_11360 [bacterium]
MKSLILKFDPEPSGRFAHQVLKGTGIKGILIGRLAVWAWVDEPSEHAYTKDIDIAVTKEDLPKIYAWLAEHKITTIRQLVLGGINVNQVKESINIDFITRSGEFGDLSQLFEDAIKEALKSKRTIEIGGEVLSLVSSEHLIAMKIGTGEREDERDAARVLDYAKVDVKKARHLVMTFLGPAGIGKLEAILREIGHPSARKRGKYN